MKLLDGKTLAEKKKRALIDAIHTAGNNNKRNPNLSIILVGNDFSSAKYVEYKEKSANEVGIDVKTHRLSESVTEKELTGLISGLNTDESVDGIMVQLPLPEKFQTSKILNVISQTKDVDGLTEHSFNGLKDLVNLEYDEKENIYRIYGKENSSGDLGKPLSNLTNQSNLPVKPEEKLKSIYETFVPATALAIYELLKSYEVKIKGSKVAIVGASKIVGIPAGILLALAGGDVTICRSKTKNIKEYTRSSDIVISATGVPNLIQADWVKDGVVAVDVGFTKDSATGKVVGDIKFDEVSQKAEYISKAVGGVGPMTITCLLDNVVKAWQKNVS